MGQSITNQSADFEQSKVSRRNLISGIAVTTVAAPAIAAESGNSADPGIKRAQAVPGLQTPMANGKFLYSHVTSSSRKKMIFVSGQGAHDAHGNLVGKDDPKAQMRQICENLKAALAVEGATLADLVQTSIFLTSWDKFRAAFEVRSEYFGQHLPTATAIQVPELGSAEAMFEINAIAMVEG